MIRLPLLLIAGFVLAPATLRADTIVLANGNELHGEIVSETAQSVTIRIGTGTMVIPRSSIREIKKGSAQGLLERARDLAYAGLYDEALEHARRALAADPASSEAREALGLIHLAHARHLAGVAEFDAAREALREARSSILDPAFADRVADTFRSIDADQETLAARREAARSALAQGDLDRAILGWEAVARSDPGPETEDALFDALVRRGDRSAAGGQVRGALADFDRAIRVSPRRSDSLEIRWTSALSRIAYEESILSGDGEGALAVLARAETLFPANPLVLFVRGLAHESIGRDTDALAAYRRALVVLGEDSPDLSSVQKTRERVRETLGLPAGVVRPIEESRLAREALADWATLERGPFTIRHKSAYHAQRVALALEHHLERIARDLTGGSIPEWTRPCEVVIHPDSESFLAATGQPAWAGGATEITFADGRLLSHRISLHQDAPDLLSSTVPHELAHVLTPAIHGYRGMRHRWIEEGIAVRFESAEAIAWRVQHAEDALDRGRLPEISDFLRESGVPADAGAAQDLYSFAHALVDYLLELGDAASVLEFGDELASDPRQDPGALARRVFGRGAPDATEDLDQGWRAHIRKR